MNKNWILHILNTAEIFALKEFLFWLSTGEKKDFKHNKQSYGTKHVQMYYHFDRFGVMNKLLVGEARDDIENHLTPRTDVLLASDIDIDIQHISALQTGLC